MVRRKETKTTALVLTAVCTILSAVQYVSAWPQLHEVGICRDCSFLARLSYSFFHANIIHTLINCWCLLSVVFVYDVTPCYILLAYGIAVTTPVNYSDTPTVGLSAVCFALLGMIMFQVRRKFVYNTWVLSFILAGYALPHLCSLCGCYIASPNNMLHLYCYVVGLLVGFLNSPVSLWQRKR